MNYNPNDPILADYQQRYHEAYDRMTAAIEAKRKPLPADYKLMRELHYIMTEYRRDPFQPILMTKLAYRAEEYETFETMMVFFKDYLSMLDWWYKWKPGALFV